MAFKTTRLTALFANHSHDADILQPLQSGTLLKFVGGNESATNKLTIDGEIWLNLVFTPPGGVGIAGWVLGAHCEVAEEVRVELKIDGFVRTSLMLERQFNLMETTAPWFANAEYVIARAIIETSLSNAGQKIPGSNAVGPLQVSADEWAALLKDGGAFAEGLTEADRDDPQLQVYAAIFRMNADAQAFSNIKEHNGVDPSDKGYLPTYLDLLHSYLLNSPEAAAAVADAQTTDAGRAKTMKEVLAGVLKDEQVTALFAARGGYLGTSDVPKIVGQFVDDAEAKLTAALKQASDLIGQHVPDEVPSKPSEPTIKVVPIDPGNVEELPATDPPDFAALNTPAHEAFWPVITDDHQALVVSYEDKAGKIVGNNGRKFFANRRNGARHHVGMDVFCKDGDEVVACADGTIVNFYYFYKSGIGEPTYALFVDHDGVVVNYGEVKGDAPKKFGWKVGDKVTAGQKIAVVSSTNMVHFETYVPGTKQNSRWLAGEKRPSGLRNPTLLLLNLAANATRIGIDGRRSISGGSGQVAGGGGTPVSIDKDDLLTLARTIYGEAGTQADPPAAREAIAHVVTNRLQRRYLGDNTISKVCRHDKEFPCWNVDNLPAGQFDKSADGPRVARISSMVSGADPIFDQCIDTAEQVMKGLLVDNTGGATHYCSASDARPDWAKPPARLTAVIGSRLFFANVTIAGPGPIVITPPVVSGSDGGSPGDHTRYQPRSPDAARKLGGIVDLANRANPINHGFRGVRFLATLPGGQLMFDSELQLDTDGWPGATGDRTHQNQTSYRYANRGSINANEVPFFVLPQPATWPAKFGIKMGDIAAVVFQDKLAFAVFADAGPSTKLGEGSLELHRRLGVERLRANGTVQDVGMGPGVITVVFPGTRLTPAPANQTQLLNHIETNGRLLFQQLGGNPL